MRRVIHLRRRQQGSAGVTRRSGAGASYSHSHPEERRGGGLQPQSPGGAARGRSTAAVTRRSGAGASYSRSHPEERRGGGLQPQSPGGVARGRPTAAVTRRSGAGASYSRSHPEERRGGGLQPHIVRDSPELPPSAAGDADLTHPRGVRGWYQPTSCRHRHSDATVTDLGPLTDLAVKPERGGGGTVMPHPTATLTLGPGLGWHCRMTSSGLPPRGTARRHCPSCYCPPSATSGTGCPRLVAHWPAPLGNGTS